MDTIAVLGGFGEVARRLVLAMVIGCALGINRDLQNKPAGLRTHALVALGAALIVITSIGLAHAGTPPDTGSVLRVVQGVITGIGFLGGGVILRDSTGRVVAENDGHGSCPTARSACRRRVR